MKQEVIDKVLELHAPKEETKKKYVQFYDKVADFEQQNGLNIDQEPFKTVKAFIDAQNNSDCTAINQYLLYCKNYCQIEGKDPAVQEIISRDFDLTTGMRMSLIPSLHEMYARARLVYAPENGDMIFPLISFAWMGMELREALQCQESDVDLLEGVIRNHTTLFKKMPEEMVQNLKIYNQVQVVRRDNRKIEMPCRIGPFIYKTVSAGSERANSCITSKNTGRCFKSVRDKYNSVASAHTKTTYGDIVQSARFAKMRQLELSGIDWSSPSNNTLMQSIFNTDRTEPTYIRYNYEMYKKTFGLI